MERRLYRSEENKVIAGVCGGIGEYFDVDPVFVRIVTVILAFATGVGFFGYIIAWIIMPKSTETISMNGDPAHITPNAMPQPKREFSSWNRYLPGLILIGIGIIWLINENWFWFDWEEFWPVALILVGLALIFRKRSHTPKTVEDPAAAQAKMHNGDSKTENGGSLA